MKRRLKKADISGGGSMSKYRVYELAKEFQTESKVVLDILARNKFRVANHMSSVGEDERAAVARARDLSKIGRGSKVMDRRRKRRMTVDRHAV